MFLPAVPPPMNLLTDVGGLVLWPLYLLISAVLVGWYRLFTDVLGLDADGGLAWVLAIIGLTVVVRTALIPLFVRQIRSSRDLQLIAPKVRELQAKYGDDPQRLAQETKELYRESGTNPFASCLPLLIQMPVFLALFRLLRQATNGIGHSVLSDALATRFGHARLFGEVQVSASFLHADGVHGVQLLAAALVLAMTATTFLTQRQLMTKNMPDDALSGPYAQQQKMLLYVLPVVFAVGGIAFPIGLLVYWTTSNLWTLGQQFYVIRNNPAPGTPAMRAKEERDRAKRDRHRPDEGQPGATG